LRDGGLHLGLAEEGRPKGTAVFGGIGDELAEFCKVGPDAGELSLNGPRLALAAGVAEAQVNAIGFGVAPVQPDLEIRKVAHS
jgi:hypothetical protein